MTDGCKSIVGNTHLKKIFTIALLFCNQVQAHKCESLFNAKTPLQVAETFRSTDRFGYTDLAHAISNRDIERINVLLENPALDINEKNSVSNRQETYLNMAIMTNNIEIVKLILSHKNVDINDGNRLHSNFNDLMIVQNIEMIDLFLARPELKISIKDIDLLFAKSLYIESLNPAQSHIKKLEWLNRILNHPGGNSIEFNDVDLTDRSRPQWVKYLYEPGAFKILLKNNKIDFNRVYGGKNLVALTDGQGALDFIVNSMNGKSYDRQVRQLRDESLLNSFKVLLSIKPDVLKSHRRNFLWNVAMGGTPRTLEFLLARPEFISTEVGFTEKMSTLELAAEMGLVHFVQTHAHSNLFTAAQKNSAIARADYNLTYNWTAFFVGKGYVDFGRTHFKEISPRAYQQIIYALTQ